jgi:hypothetical protein
LCKVYDVLKFMFMFMCRLHSKEEKIVLRMSVVMLMVIAVYERASKRIYLCTHTYIHDTFIYT